MADLQTITCRISGIEDSTRQVRATIIEDQGKAFIHASVVCKFRTGTKLHTSHMPLAWKEKDGTYYIDQNEHVMGKRCRIIGWKDSADQTNSGWTDAPRN